MTVKIFARLLADFTVAAVKAREGLRVRDSKFHIPHFIPHFIPHCKPEGGGFKRNVLELTVMQVIANHNEYGIARNCMEYHMAHVVRHFVHGNWHQRAFVLVR